MDPNPQQIMDTLGLKPHPTCGFVTETYRSQLQIPQAALPAGNIELRCRAHNAYEADQYFRAERPRPH